MPKFLEGHSRPVAQGIVSDILFEVLRWGASPVLGWTIKQGAVYFFSISTGWAITIWIAATVVLISLATILKRKYGTMESNSDALGNTAKPAIGGSERPININIDNKPVFHNSPHIDQRPINYQTQQQTQQWSAPPVLESPAIEPLKVKPREMFVTPLGEVTDSPTSFGEANQKAFVAIADLYRAPDRYHEAFVDVSARILFYLNRDELDRVDNGFWFKSPRHHIQFKPGDTRKLVVGVFGDDCILPYDGKFKPLEATYDTNEKYFELNPRPLVAKELRVVVEIIGVSPRSVTVLSMSVDYKVELSPLVFTHINTRYHDLRLA
jgi:hypothetical protein